MAPDLNRITPMAFKQVANDLLNKLSSFDHRAIGIKQKLFFFDERSKGSCFFKPRGAHIYNKLVDYLRQELKKRHYEEVLTPNIYSCDLWKQSGHWDHYKDNMIRFHMGEREHSLKPMNCPGHCVMYQELGTVRRSQLPIRWADFGVLHRNELSGSLMGLTRVRRFQQDDAHIFCAPDQVGQEVRDCLDFARQVYLDFGFQKFKLFLSLRPETFMGELEAWNRAEDSLRKALDASKLPWTEREAEGAFYGPKIDLAVEDTQQRSHQCATIQLDFQLPNRFDLTFKDDTGRHRPVMIHRAIFGSIERFIAMLAENSQGTWPFWLSPIQVQVIPVHENLNEYAESVEKRLKLAGFTAEVATEPGMSLNKKIREAEMAKFNFVLVVGNKESQSDSVTVRMKDGSKNLRQIIMRLDHVIELFKAFEEKRVLDAGAAFLAASAEATSIKD